MSLEDNRPNLDDIKLVVSETIKEVHEAQALRLKKPETLQGWIYVLGAFGALVAFMWTSIVFLQGIADHHELPYHHGVETLVSEVQKQGEMHAQDSRFHKREEELQLQILKETKPIRDDINTIKEDVRSIQTKVDILIDRQERDRNNP